MRHLVRRLLHRWHRRRFRHWLGVSADLCAEGIAMIAATNPTLAGLTSQAVDARCEQTRQLPFVTVRDLYDMSNDSLAIVRAAMLQEYKRRNT